MREEVKRVLTQIGRTVLELIQIGYLYSNPYFYVSIKQSFFLRNLICRFLPIKLYMHATSTLIGVNLSTLYTPFKINTYVQYIQSQLEKAGLFQGFVDCFLQNTVKIIYLMYLPCSGLYFCNIKGFKYFEVQVYIIL